MTRTEHGDLICFCHLRWKFVFQRPQHLLTRWSKLRRVFFFEEPVFHDGENRLELEIDEADGSGVIVVTPHLRTKLTSDQIVSQQRSLLYDLVDARGIGVGRNLVVWYYTPLALEFTQDLPAVVTVYDCMDELSAFRGAPPELGETERRLLERADLVFTGGQSLYEAKRHLHRDVHAFPSAVDVMHFATARTMTAQPPDQAGIPQPRFGFYGVLDERFDGSLVGELAERRPDWHFIFVGPTVKIDPQSLPRRANLHYLGAKAYADLPRYLAGWDVALLPFAKNESTRFISPTKTPEYLAAGKAVVSTSIRDVVRPYGEMGLVHIADTAPEFERAIESAMREDAAARIARVDPFLAARSWDATWHAMAMHVDRAMTLSTKRVRARTSPVAAHPLKPTFDFLIVGAGYAGTVTAERLASSGKTVLLVDKRPHLGGNAYDHYDEAGLLVHRYGPHIFHTNSAEVFDYLSLFTAWRPYEHRVLASVHGKLLPIPINLDTVNRLYDWDLDAAGLEVFFRSVAERRNPIRTSEDVIVSRVGRDLYEKFFKHYTRKQWGLDPSELDATVIARIPVRTDRDDRYFTDKYQAMPLDGYTAMFERIVARANITVELGVDYRDVVDRVAFGTMIYTGPIDAFFGFRYGKLPYRSLDFEFETHSVERFQAGAVVNYPNEHEFTRSTEFKFLTGQKHDKTTIVYEYPRAQGDPYYPVPRPENAGIYAKYQALGESVPNVHFVGRLATYKYYNMDQVAAQALTLAAKLQGVSRRELLGLRATRIATPVAIGPAEAAPWEGAVAAEHAAVHAGAASSSEGIELWGGIECTVNRVGDRYFDQVARSGHRGRLHDLDRFAAIGITALRYPLLWEVVAPNGPSSADWSFTDRALGRVRQLGIRPIAGLIHHGSGPPWTDLLKPTFVTGLVEYARACAQRYPWIADWTPVNEPLTTGRFSALYGVWYPHTRDDAAFACAVFHQCRATALAMRAIRSVIPGARLVQTEDVGTVRSTPRVAYQADFENERRWLSLDLLCGNVKPGSVGWDILRRGVGQAELEAFLAEPCPPDIVGVNYYVTSDRFLDHRSELYPPECRGGNGRDAYADIEAARSPDAPPPDHLISVLATVERYRLPVAITECHIDSTREDQVRWLMQAWRAAERAKEIGHDVRAVTVWALNGSYDWNTLVTADSGHYESGAFDLRAPSPRPTAVAKFASVLARHGSAAEHPVLGAPGWWQRPSRAWHHREQADGGDIAWVRAQRERPPILITGGCRRLGRAFALACERRGLPYRLATSSELDIVDSARTLAALEGFRPWAVINAAGFIHVDEAERSPEACFRENAIGAKSLAEACVRYGVRLLTFSTDLVFDGGQNYPYVESDAAKPLNIYGLSKLKAEQLVLAVDPSALVVRTGALFGPCGDHDFVASLLRAWRKNELVRVPNDWVVSPTYIPDLVRASLDFLIDGEHGIWHVANGGAVTWAEFAWRVAALSRTTPCLEECKTSALDWPAKRPPYSALGSERGRVTPTLDASLEHYLDSRSSHHRGIERL